MESRACTCVRSTAIKNLKIELEGYRMSQATSQRFVKTIGTLQIAIIALVVITALIHLQKAIGMSFGGGPGGPRPGGGPGGPPPGGGGGFNIMAMLPIPL